MDREGEGLFTAGFWHTQTMLPDFAQRLVQWQGRFGRHDLPWQSAEAAPDPYPIWLSEIMLQQTQVETVIPYFQRFLARFPDIASLAAADQEEVLACWAGLGYYSRARNLHAAARRILLEHGGRFPGNPETIQALPGIGRSTAAAIAAFAYDQRLAILDGNVKRVLARLFGVEGWPGEKSVEARLWALAQNLLPEKDIRAYTQGLMDLGATLCTRSRPRCEACPFADDCVANQEGRHRELPGARPRKALPERRTAMLAIIHAGEVLLEKRPAPGIWGGLWSLPECAADENVRQAVVGLGYRVETCEALPVLVHGFTHFRLTIAPWRVDVQRPTVAGEPGRVWIPLAELAGAALPTPVQRILAPLGQ
jgi:A/G-specific adenine glycosylase